MLEEKIRKALKPFEEKFMDKSTESFNTYKSYLNKFNGFNVKDWYEYFHIENYSEDRFPYSQYPKAHDIMWKYKTDILFINDPYAITRYLNKIELIYNLFINEIVSKLGEYGYNKDIKIVRSEFGDTNNLIVSNKGVKGKLSISLGMDIDESPVYYPIPLCTYLITKTPYGMYGAKKVKLN